ncbi:SbcC/MukB-like Walker B domain-containing protein [Planococcus donghaensis]|uniref:Nuclease SbcCD subunit C n=1 Tax=Planococcus donghaensis TaxID=414778 RepID=A0A1C7EL44_9BACL|nr:SMC family ATPase [Planococcus donghaensis]ANU24445.1 exonuclease [Planococcus donghaensis]
MRPLKLKMTAFGPYKNTEEIDFANLQGNQLFVISGSTGSGKTTIFDGICFALYGSASGSDRSESRILRSDFAEDATHTAVEMEFEIHDKKYRVLRQMSHIKKGNKSPTGERFEFFEQTEEGEKPAVERQIVSEINRRIEEIVGLTQNQFSQIVMLPQGEFRKLLTSETDNKEEILRKIFKTEPYKLISERLKQKKDAAEKIFDREHHKMNIHLQQISSSLPERQSDLFEVLSREHKNINQVLDGLEKEAAYYREKISIDEKKYEKAYQQHADKMTAYHEAKKWNDRFDELSTKNDQLEQLVQRQPEYAEKEIALQSAERASYIANIEQLVHELRRNEIDKNKLLKDTIDQQEHAKQTRYAAEQTFHIQQALQSERDKVSEQLIELEKLLPTIQEIAVKKQQLVQLEKTSNQSANRLKKAEEEFNEQKSEKQQLDKKVAELENMLDASDDMHQKLTVVTEKYRIVTDYILLKEQTQQLQAMEKAKKVKLEEKTASYRQLEDQWFANQAHVLAGQLHAGEACPVCGSTEHPGTKISNTEQAVTKEQVEVAKSYFDQVDGEYRNASAKRIAIEEQLENKAHELMALKLRVEEVVEVSTELEQTKIQLTERMKQQQAHKLELRKWKEQLASCIEKIEQLEQNKQTLTKEVQQHSSSFQTAAAVFENDLATVPEDLRELPALKEQLQQVSSRKQHLETQWKAAQEQFQLSKEQLASAEVSVRHATETAREAAQKSANTEQQFVQALEKSSFDSEQAYQQAKMTEAAFTALKKDIQEFNQHRHTLTQQVRELKELLADQRLKDLSQAEIELSALKANYESAFAEQNRSRDFEKISNELIDSIQSVIETALEAERNLNRIADLHNMIRGQNGLKISFERYLQIEYLEQIILSANERLKNLSNGQFYLIRSDRQEARGKQSGLGLDVYDAYTGQTRDVKTMSGGEKFNASLCLALGMADVIQSFQGNVSIDTMFIDEGFGSLDEESLNKSIETLVDLQKSGRMIGVISHVQELKAAIPAILQVEKSKEGYSRTKFVIK